VPVGDETDTTKAELPAEQPRQERKRKQRQRQRLRAAESVAEDGGSGVGMPGSESGERFEGKHRGSTLVGRCSRSRPGKGRLGVLGTCTAKGRNTKQGRAPAEEGLGLSAGIVRVGGEKAVEFLAVAVVVIEAIQEWGCLKGEVGVVSLTVLSVGFAIVAAEHAAEREQGWHPSPLAAAVAAVAAGVETVAADDIAVVVAVADGIEIVAVAVVAAGIGEFAVLVAVAALQRSSAQAVAQQAGGAEEIALALKGKCTVGSSLRIAQLSAKENEKNKHEKNENEKKMISFCCFLCKNGNQYIDPERINKTRMQEKTS